jgi:hypothetical protein
MDQIVFYFCSFAVLWKTRTKPMKRNANFVSLNKAIMPNRGGSVGSGKQVRRAHPAGKLFLLLRPLSLA